MVECPLVAVSEGVTVQWASACRNWWVSTNRHRRPPTVLPHPVVPVLLAPDLFRQQALRGGSLQVKLRRGLGPSLATGAAQVNRPLIVAIRLGYFSVVSGESGPR